MSEILTLHTSETKWGYTNAQFAGIWLTPLWFVCSVCVINDKLLKNTFKRGEKTSGLYYTMVLKVTLESISPNLLPNTIHDDIFWLIHWKFWDIIIFQINENKEKTYLECHSYNKHLRWLSQRLSSSTQSITALLCELGESVISCDALGLRVIGKCGSPEELKDLLKFHRKF